MIRDDRTAERSPCDINDLDVRLEVVEDSACSRRYARQHRLRDLVPHDMCLYLFNSAFPYILTLSHGGWFKWVKPGEGVVMQCPSAVGCVTMSVTPGADGVEVSVIGRKGVCPKGHEKGQRFTIDPERATFCVKAIGGLVPFLAVAAKGAPFPWTPSHDVRCAACEACFRIMPP